MSLIDSYEKFCRAFNGSPDEVKQAELLLFVQDFIIRIIDKIDEEGSDYSLDALVIGNADKSHLRFAKKDAVSRLVDDSYDAVRRISGNMRENIVRENVRMPVYKVREVNSHGLNWLSRRPGATIKEKISSANSSMMAVQRRMSLDTGENRLYIAYLKELAELLQNKLENFPKNQRSTEEESFCSWLFSVIRAAEFEEIGRWENMPPNNTLLSDQNYKKVWRCWNELKIIDTLIAEDSAGMDDRICTVFYIELLTKAGPYFCFPQIPVLVDYVSYTVRLYSKVFLGVDPDGQLVEIVKEKEFITMVYHGKKIVVEFCNGTIQIITDDGKEYDTPITVTGINRYVDLVIAQLGCKKTSSRTFREIGSTEKTSFLIMDLFSVRPEYISDNGDFKALKGRLLNQTHVWEEDGKQAKFEISCDHAGAVMIGEHIETYTVATTVEKASGFQMSKLMHLLERYVSAQKFTFLFPDIYNEFQLSLVHKASRLVFHEVRSFPRSVGAAFAYMSTGSFERSFRRNDFLLIMDIVDTDLSLTLIQGIEDETAAGDIPEYGGVIWERHPSLSYSLKTSIQEGIYDKLIRIGCDNPEYVYSLLGIKGFESENGLLAVIAQDKKSFIIDERAYDGIKAVKINVTDKVNEFYRNHKETIGNSRVHVISVSSHLLYKGTGSFETLSPESVLEGCRIYEELQTRSHITLWRDHLPELAIKLLYGRFNLVDHETITPEFNVEKKIKIGNVFTLEKGMNEYHFDLVQNDVNRKIRYAAVVKNPAFPINRDVRCRLDMTYQYGAEEPYRLLFIPLDKDAGFAEAKVSWERITSYPYEGLPCPEPIPSMSWGELETFQGKYGVQDLVKGLIGTYKRIAQGYYCYDFSGYVPTLYGKPGNKFFVVAVENGDENAALILNERNQEKQINNEPQVNFSEPGRVSCELHKVDLDSDGRYQLDLSADARFNEIWKRNQYGYWCSRSLVRDGMSCQVAFYADNFVDPSQFHPDIQRISFGLHPSKDGKYIAVNIIDRDAPEISYYKAYNMRTGNRPGRQVYGPKNFFLLHTIMAGRNSQYEADAPMELQNAFEEAVNAWFDSYHQTENENIRRSIFGQMSIVARDIGDPYYDLAISAIDDYLQQKSKYVNVNIGYALGALDSSRERELWNKIADLPRDELMVSILSKAVWANSQFIKNVEIPGMLEYFNFAIDYLERIYRTHRRDTERNVTSCIELLLGMFRLREYNDTELCRKLSLNNPKLQKLYSITEDLIRMTQEGAITIKSFLKLEITNSKDKDNLYKDIPAILYAMLVFITGEKGAGDIKISGIDLDDVDV